jgi:DNA-binding NtrC family response regulator
VRENIVSEESTPRAGEAGSAESVLVVDDDMAWLSSVERWLAREGFRVIGMSRGQWVVQAVDFHQPDAVVLDVHLPGVDGLDVLGQLRRRRPEIPVIIMTAFGDLDVADRARRLGAADYFNKPFRLNDLVNSIRHLRRSRKAG